MIQTAYWYLHTDQWRYDQFGADALASPLGERPVRGQDDRRLIAAVAHGWAGCRPTRTFDRNPLDLADEAAGRRQPGPSTSSSSSKSGELELRRARTRTRRRTSRGC